MNTSPLIYCSTQRSTVFRKLRIMMEMLISIERAVINAAMVITVLAIESWI